MVKLDVTVLGGTSSILGVNDLKIVCLFVFLAFLASVYNRHSPKIAQCIMNPNKTRLRRVRLC